MIKKFLKGQKGISLITLTIAVMVILVLTNVIILNVTDNLRIEKLKALQTDISNLRDKVSNYYAKFGTIPIVDVEYKNINNIKSAGLISEVNDSGRFYVIDLDKIENLTLNYGRDYEKITPSSTDTEINSYTDIYIINSTSHNIFYVKGVKIDNDWYYTDYLAEDIDLAPINLKYIDNVRIPEGFYYVDGKKDTGIIISDVEGDDIQNSKKGNQYVWVPVEDFDEFVRKDFGRQNIADANFVNTEKTASKYYEAVGDGVSAGSEVEQMYRSVKQNKGFYIARFEAGQVSGQVVSKKGENVYSSVKWGNADETGGAVALARNVYPKSADKDVISTLCYGVQWDAIMRWVSKDNNLSKYLTDSSQIGNYSNSSSPAKTGANDNYQIKNIYDLAGNVGEWTMENYNQNNYVIRGGDFSKTDSNYKTLASRAGGTLDYTNANTGFRVALYLKADKLIDETQKPMIIKVNTLEDGKVVLPILPTENCIVDWEDGIISSYGEENSETAIKDNIKIASTNSIKLAASIDTVKGISHQYEEMYTNKEKIIKIYGQVQKIINTNATETGEFYDYSKYKIREIVNWGEIGIKYIKLNSYEELNYIDTIPKNVIELDLGYCYSLENIQVDDNNLVYSSEEGVVFNKDKTELVQYPLNRSGSEYTIPSNVLNIGEDAFSRCENLTVIKIPKNVETIGDRAFAHCVNLTNITMEYGLKNIGDSAFASCDSLTNIILPNSVTTIGDNSFDFCKKLANITIPNSVTSIGSQAFFFCNEIANITIPSSVTDMGWAAFNYWKDNQKINIQFKESQLPDGWNISWDNGCKAIISYLPE